MAATGTECPPSLRQAVDVLVAEQGVAGAERALRDRIEGQPDRRTLAALAYLRREYEE